MNYLALVYIAVIAWLMKYVRVLCLFSASLQRPQRWCRKSSCDGCYVTVDINVD